MHVHLDNPSNHSPQNSCDLRITGPETAFLIVGIALVVFGSLIVSGIMPIGNFSIIAFPFYSFGATIEGSACIALGSIAILGIIGRVCVPNFRNYTN